MPFPKGEFRVTQEALRNVMDSLEHPCMHCAANFVFDGVKKIVATQTGLNEDLLANLTVLLSAAYQIHIDLNVVVHGESYPPVSKLIDLEELVQRAAIWTMN